MIHENITDASVINMDSLSKGTHSNDVEKMLNVSKNHVVKGGSGIRDDLPGIGKNKYG